MGRRLSEGMGRPPATSRELPTDVQQPRRQPASSPLRGRGKATSQGGPFPGMVVQELQLVRSCRIRTGRCALVAPGTRSSGRAQPEDGLLQRCRPPAGSKEGGVQQLSTLAERPRLPLSALATSLVSEDADPSTAMRCWRAEGELGSELIADISARTCSSSHCRRRSGSLHGSPQAHRDGGAGPRQELVGKARERRQVTLLRVAGEDEAHRLG